MIVTYFAEGQREHIVHATVAERSLIVKFMDILQLVESIFF